VKSAITISGKELLVNPPKYPAEEIKEELGGRWDKHRKVWRLPITALNVETLVEWYGVDILKDAPEAVFNIWGEEWGFKGWNHHGIDEVRNRAEFHPKWDDLYPFQQLAVEYLVCNPHHGSLLGLDPGLGKGPVSIVAMDILEVTKVLIVAPLTLARNWLKEIDKWERLYRSWSRATRSEKDPRTECVVTNHEVLFDVHLYDEDGNDVIVPGGPKKQKEWIEKGPKEINNKGNKVPKRKRTVEIRESYDIDWDLIIIDESVLLKNRHAVKLDMIFSLAKYAKWIWLLSGSPTTRFNNDLYPQMKLIMPRAFRSYWRFTEFFCTVDKGQWGWKISGDKPNHPPAKYLKDFMFLRSQKEVLPELPDYIYDPIEVDLTAKQQRAFNDMMTDWYTMLDDGTEVEATIKLAQMTRAAQITSNLINIGGDSSSAKEDLLTALIDNDDIEFPLLVWTWWVPTAQSVFDRLCREPATKNTLGMAYVIGDMPTEEKDEILEGYKGGKFDMLVLQMGVGKFGHTLTNTRTVFYHDRHFDSDAYFQSLRRVRRIGLGHRPRLIVPRSTYSFDPIVELNLAGKLQSIAKMSNKDLKELLQSLGAGMVPWSMEYAE
jgi:SNF2-related domain/Helicase conserved C-terminal domain